MNVQVSLPDWMPIEAFAEAIKWGIEDGPEGIPPYATAAVEIGKGRLINGIPSNYIFVTIS